MKHNKSRTKNLQTKLSVLIEVTLCFLGPWWLKAAVRLELGKRVIYPFSSSTQQQQEASRKRKKKEDYKP